MTSLLEISGLSSGYGSIPILRDVSLEVSPGEVVGIQGYNGMGKTTLMLTIMGLIQSTSGSIRFDGEELVRMPAHQRARRGIALVPQGRMIMPSLTVAENIRFAFVDCGDEDEEGTISRLCGMFPSLEELLGRRGGALSGGQQQLLAIARALASRPRLLLLDEPTEGIQPTIVARIAELVVQLRDEYGLAVIVTEQDESFASKVCSRVYSMHRGRLESGSTHGLHHQPPAVRPGPSEVRLQPPASAPVRTASRGSKPEKRRSAATEPPPRDLKMPIKRPSLEQLQTISESMHMNMSDAELLEYRDCMEGTLHAYDRVSELTDNIPHVHYPRTTGRRPDPGENQLNAWYVKSEVTGAPSGPLAGRKVVLKDNIALAGVPMMNGASILEGYIPDIDATIVQRILDAGGTILGKASCEHLCFSGGSHTCDTGAVHNPYRNGYSAGGSSSGCGALVGAGEVDMAIGGDQGGSIRIPSSWCGCYGMKPTHGLVPYSGAFPIEATIDHLGPMTSTVSDNALLLGVIAGSDGLDPRQYSPKTDDYMGAIGAGVSGLRIGVLDEGFGWPSMEADVAQKVRAGSEKFRELGATVENVSLPDHLDAAAVWTPIALEGMMDKMMDGNAHGSNWRGLFLNGLTERFASSWRTKADSLSPSLKISMMIGKYFQTYHAGRYYGKAQNISRRIRRSYDELFKRFDLLLMPTLPMKATPHPPDGASLSLYTQRSFEMIPNTAPFNMTGHPAMNVPCGLSEGLPVGMMLVGAHWRERTIYSAAYAFEQIQDWRRL